MSRLARTVTSSIGSKAVMSVTGVLLLLFVLGHMAGNLQVFLGPDALNAYAAKLQGLGPFLWVVRLGLLAVFLTHIGAAVKVTTANRAARPIPYQFPATVQTSFASRSMVMTGLIVLAFVVYHVLHFTVGVTHPDLMGHEDAQGRHDVYRMVVLSFREWPVAASYMIANILLGLHIGHGASSAFQSLGVTQPRLAWLKNGFGPAIGSLIVIGNVAMPLACLIGLVPLNGEAQ